jgi:uncharacterized membrane protein YdbT with pleckstrin-like domain
MSTEQIAWEGTPSQIINFKAFLWCILIIPIPYAIWRWLDTRSQKYQLTSQRLKFSRGIFSRLTDEIELYRVKDIQLLEPFLLRIWGCGNIILVTSDRSAPNFVMPVIKNATAVREQIREFVETSRMKRNVREVDME